MIPLYKPYIPTELTQLHNILHSDSLSYGKWGKKFEDRLQSFIGCKNLMTVNSYFMASQIVFMTLGLKSGDEVITSPMSCLASNQPLQTYGLKIVWADIDPSTGTIDPNDVRNKITSKTKLIIHNHFCGYIGYVDEINTIGKEFGIPVIDDCIEAFGAKYKNNYVGNLGTNITIFSFQTVRLPNAIEGGAIIFTDKTLFNKALLIRDFGIDRSRFRDKYNEISLSCDISISGYGATLNDINSYIGCCQTNDLTDLLYTQQKNARAWDQIIKSQNKLYSIDREEVQPNYWVYGILSNDKINDMLTFRSRNFYASSVHLPNNYYSVFGKKVFLKGVDDFYSKFLAIPSGWWINESDIYNFYEKDSY